MAKQKARIKAVQTSEYAQTQTQTQGLRDDDAQALEEVLAASLAENTVRGYEIDLRQWQAWCTERGYRALPATSNVAAAWAVHLGNEGKAYATIGRMLAAVASLHRTAGVPGLLRSGAVNQALRGLRRKLGTKQKQKLPLLREELHEVLAAAPDSFRWLKRRALLLVGWSAALRRSELAVIRLEHLTFEDEGLALWIPKSKTDQESAGCMLHVPRTENEHQCPVVMLARWLVESEITSGNVFRKIYKNGSLGDRITGRHINEIVKNAASMIGRPGHLYGGHSLRAGLVTSAMAAGLSPLEISLLTRHKSMQTLRRYVRPQDPYGTSLLKKL